MNQLRIILTALLFLCMLFLMQNSWADNQYQYVVTGINDPLLKNVLLRLKINRDSYPEKLSHKDIIHLFDRGESEIKKAVEPFGYFKASISEHLSQKENTFTAHYHVNKGPAIRISEIDIQLTGQGKNNPALVKLLQNLPIKDGDIFTADHYDQAKEELLDTAHDQGYLKAKFIKAQIHLYLQDYIGTIALNLDTGSQFFYGPVTFNQIPIAESLLKRYINFQSNQPVSYNKLLDFQQALAGSDYFQNVLVTPKIDQVKKQKVPIDVKLMMKKNKSYRFGVGYGTNSGPRATIGYNQRWVNRWGHKFNALIKLSEIQSSLAAQYLIPGEDPTKEHYAINGNILHQTPRNGESLSKTIGVAHIKNYQLWQRIFGLNLEYAKYRFESNERFHRSKLLYPSITLTRLKSSHRLNPKNKTSLIINLIGSTHYFVSTVSLLQTKIDAAWLHSLNHNNRFILSAHYGYTIADDFNKVPLTKYFYAGGIDSLRGYKFLGLGPGRYLMTASAEYQYRVYKNWYLAAFYDIGNAFNHFDYPLKRGTGFGFVWQTKMGDLKVYLAKALSDSDQPWRVEFSFGPQI